MVIPRTATKKLTLLDEGGKAMKNDTASVAVEMASMDECVIPEDLAGHCWQCVNGNAEHVPEGIVEKYDEAVEQINTMSDFKMPWEEQKTLLKTVVKTVPQWDAKTGHQNTMLFISVSGGDTYNRRRDLRDAGFRFRKAEWYSMYDLREEDTYKECPLCKTPIKGKGFTQKKEWIKPYTPIRHQARAIGPFHRDECIVSMNVSTYLMMKVAGVPLPSGDPHVGSYDMIYFV